MAKNEGQKTGRLSTFIIVIVIVFAVFFLFLFIWYVLYNFGPMNQDLTNDATQQLTASTSKVSKDEIINSLVKTTLYDTTGKAMQEIVRWNKSPVYIKITGQVDEKTSACLDNFIKEFNSLSNTIKLARTESNADIIITVLPYKEIEKYQQKNTVGAKAFAIHRANDNCEIYSGTIYISTELRNTENQSSTCHSIKHELIHSLGFVGHDNKIKGCSVFGVACVVSNLIETDQRIIKTFYNSGLPLCSGEKELRNYLQNWNP